jgi:hypothetical protein
MTISFVCPQGHPLTAPEDMAGRAGKCPHCGTRFLIPHREGSARSAGGSPAAGGSTAGTGSMAGVAGTRSEQIVFFCPNGHKLNGPATLRGKLGLCPHCQSRFRIPAEPEAADAAPPGELVDEDGEVIEGRPLDENVESGGGEGQGGDANGAAEGNLDAATNEPEAAPAPWQAPPPESTDSSRWLELTRWLWSQRDGRSAVELRLRNGSTLQPAWFSATLSDGRIGVFARQTEEGLYDIAAIAWEQVEQVDVRGCEELPSGLFE